ncbi:MAG: hypothetical protein FWF94_03030 [Oscillospiraceae bacterium]|nr:hypothetical protein [Oscillospiraceae bacterium]
MDYENTENDIVDSGADTTEVVLDGDVEDESADVESDDETDETVEEIVEETIIEHRENEFTPELAGKLDFFITFVTLAIMFALIVIVFKALYRFFKIFF